MATPSERTIEVKRALRALTRGTAPASDSELSPSGSEKSSSHSEKSSLHSEEPSSYSGGSAPGSAGLSSALDAQPHPRIPASDPRPSQSDTPAPATVVERAHEALEDVESAATFAADGGDDRLRVAVTTAERTGDRATARAGQRALATVERYRRAAGGDHFHPGRGTVFRPGSQLTGE